MAAAALAIAPDPPPPPPPHCMFENRSSFVPSAAARRVGSLRSLLKEANPSMSAGSIPASWHAFRMAIRASLNSGSGDWPCL
jgi:hypothetical protein